MRAKILVDIFLLIGMFFSMGFHLLGVGVHKLIGLLTFALFLTHNLLNRAWFGTLRKGKYSALRRTNTAVNGVLLLAMLGIMVSGVMLSGELAAGIGEGMTRGRILHNVSSYVLCVGIALHVGLHLKERRSHDDR